MVLAHFRRGKLPHLTYLFLMDNSFQETIQSFLVILVYSAYCYLLE